MLCKATERGVEKKGSVLENRGEHWCIKSSYFLSQYNHQCRFYLVHHSAEAGFELKSSTMNGFKETANTDTLD